eukprot:530266-Hanusia_phi.AAC.1
MEIVRWALQDDKASSKLVGPSGRKVDAFCRCSWRIRIGIDWQAETFEDATRLAYSLPQLRAGASDGGIEPGREEAVQVDVDPCLALELNFDERLDCCVYLAAADCSCRLCQSMVSRNQLQKLLAQTPGRKHKPAPLNFNGSFKSGAENGCSPP